MELPRSRWVHTSSEEVATTKDSRRIDATVASVMAHHRAAALASGTHDSIYL